MKRLAGPIKSQGHFCAALVGDYTWGNKQQRDTLLFQTISR